MPKVRFESSNIPTFYEFYKLLGEASPFNPKQFGRSIPAGMGEANLASSIARSLVSASELKTLLGKMSPQNNLMVKGSPGQGKSTIITQYFKTLASESNLEFAESTEDFFIKLVNRYRNDENFKSEIREILLSQYEDISDENIIENIKNLPLKTVEGMQTAIRALVKIPVDDTLQSFFDRYINSKFFIFNVTSDRDERDFFSGQSNITGERSRIDKSSKYYSISVNSSWCPYFISKINGALFIDEVTRMAFSMPEALNAVSLLLTERKVGSSKISDNIFAVAAGNFSKAELGKFTANVGDAFKQRFTPVELSVTVDDFYDYLKSKYSVYKTMDASKIHIPKNWKNVEGLGEIEIDSPETFLQAGKAAYEILEYLITTKPELFLEDKRVAIESNEKSPRYKQQRLTRRGVEIIKKDPSEKDRVKGNYLQKKSDIGAVGGDEDAEIEMMKLESANRMIEKGMGSLELIGACYYQIKAGEARQQGDSDSEAKFLDESDGHVQLLIGKGSPTWRLAIDKIFFEGDYSPLTFRNLISRQYKKIDGSKLADVFSSKTWEKQLDPEYKGEGLPDMEYDDFETSYNSDSTSMDTMMDFSILVNSYKQYFGGKEINSNQKRQFVTMMYNIKGSSDESKKKYITFVLDYCFKYRPSDAMFLLGRLMNRLPLSGKEEGAEEFNSQLLKVLQGRKNGISDAQIAQAEMAAQGMEYKGQLPEEETEQSKDKSKI